MEQDLQQAVTILRRGGLVAFPTETVYGLGADAKNPEAVIKIFQAKGRPIDHPVIVHLANKNQLLDWVCDIPPAAEILAKAFWPGPLTLIFKKKSTVLDSLSGGQQTIGIRIPKHPVAEKLLQLFGGALAAPSANRFGRISPTTAEAVREELGSSVDYILEGGQCSVGVESTIIDVSEPLPVILRPGMMTKTQIENILQQSIANQRHNAPRVSGSHASHYAPTTMTHLIETKQLPFFMDHLTEDDLPAVFLLVETKLLPRKNIDCIIMPSQPTDYAYDLYAILRDLDKKQYKKIVIESVPETPAWDAIRDRLQRASRK